MQTYFVGGVAEDVEQDLELVSAEEAIFIEVVIFEYFNQLWWSICHGGSFALWRHVENCRGDAYPQRRALSGLTVGSHGVR